MPTGTRPLWLDGLVATIEGMNRRAPGHERLSSMRAQWVRLTPRRQTFEQTFDLRRFGPTSLLLRHDTASIVYGVAARLSRGQCLMKSFGIELSRDFFVRPLQLQLTRSPLP